MKSMKIMKKSLIGILLLVVVFLFVGCAPSTNTNGENASVVSGEDVSGNTVDVEVKEDVVTSAFTLVDENGNAVTPTNNVYTISNGGTYFASGKLEEGQIYVNAPELEVEIELENVSIDNSSVSPIYVNDCDTFTLKVKKDSSNYIYDNRSIDYSETTDETIGTAAIYVANGDLKVNGKGTISITSKYNSGIHGKDNVTVKNCTMLVKAMNNGIKGNDKVTIEENPTIGIVSGNNGVRTSNSEVGSKAQHGYIYIYGGTITINSYGDGIDASYAVVISDSVDSEGNSYSPVIDIYTNKYSSYTEVSATTSSASVIRLAGGRPEGPGSGGFGGGGFNGGGFSGGKSAEKADNSAKAIKANQTIDISGGTIFMYTYDDGIHTNDDTLDSGVKAEASINISGGKISIKASDDGIHADGTLTISGGIINVAESHEGIEGNIINVSGGSTVVYANDDAVNASKQINISGGLLDVTVSANGDVDGVDSNGSITVTGGVTIARGPNSEMAAPFDADGTMSMSNGVLIIIGYAPRRLSTSLTKTSSSNGLSKGEHTVTVGSQTIKFNNISSYNGTCTVYASSKAIVE